MSVIPIDFNVNTPTRRKECTPDVAVTGNYVNCIFLLLKRKGLFRYVLILGREGGREGGTEGGREGRREGRRERGREGRKEGGREKGNKD